MLNTSLSIERAVDSGATGLNGLDSKTKEDLIRTAFENIEKHVQKQILADAVSGDVALSLIQSIYRSRGDDCYEKCVALNEVLAKYFEERLGPNLDNEIYLVYKCDLRNHFLFSIPFFRYSFLD